MESLMKATVPLLAVIVATLNLAPVRAQWMPYSCPAPALPQAPGVWTAGYGGANHSGQCYGSNYWLLPPNGPFNGMIFARQAIATSFGGGQGGQGAPAFPGFGTHPYARSPRDFFMME